MIRQIREPHEQGFTITGKGQALGRGAKRGSNSIQAIDPQMINELEGLLEDLK